MAIRKLLKQLSDRRASAFLIFLVLTTIISLILLSRLSGFNPTQLLSSHDPDKIFYDQFKNDFNASSEEQSILIALKNNKGIFQKDFLEKSDSLTKFLLHERKILRVYSLTNANLIYLSGEDINARPLIHINQPEFYKQDSEYLFQSREFRDLLISHAGDCIAIGAFNDTILTQHEKDKLIESIQAKIMQLGFDESHMISRIQFEKASIAKLKSLLLICLCGLLAVIFIGFWSLRLTTASIKSTQKILYSLVIILLAATLIFYINNKKSDPNLSDAIPKTSKAWSDMKFIENNFSGTRPFELVLMMKSSQHSFYEIEIMQKVEEIQNFLKDSLGVGSIISPMSLFKGANKAFHGGTNEYFRIPDSAAHVNRFAEAILQTEYADEMERYMFANGSTIRISGRLTDVGAARFKELSGKLQSFMDRNYSALFSHKLTGTAIIYDKALPRLQKVVATVIIVIVAIYFLVLLGFVRRTANKNHFQN
jgi:predicted RND superfamily exporter protein